MVRTPASARMRAHDEASPNLTGVSAVIDPAARPPVFFMSASRDLISSS